MYISRFGVIFLMGQESYLAEPISKEKVIVLNHTTDYIDFRETKMIDALMLQPKNYMSSEKIFIHNNSPIFFIKTEMVEFIIYFRLPKMFNLLLNVFLENLQIIVADNFACLYCFE